MSTNNHPRIVMTPGTCGGKPRIDETRIRVQDIVIWTEKGDTADDIINHYPHLSLADVHAALAYYYDNQELVDQQIMESEQFVVDMMAQQRRDRAAVADASAVSS